MFLRLLGILLCSASLAAGGVLSLTPAAGTAAGSSGMQTSPPAAPADTAGAAAEESPQVAPADTVAPATALPDTAAPEAAAPAGGVVIYGSAALADGTPLPEVRADLFVAGLEAASAVTDTSGAFSIVKSLDRAADQTVVMWFTPPRGSGLVREIVVLKESAAAKKGREFGPCFARVPLADSTLVEVQILDQKSYATKLEESGCMEKIVEEVPEFEASYALQAGDSLTVVTSATNRFVQQFGGSETAENTSSSTTLIAGVDSVGPDGMTLGVEYRDWTFTTDSPQARGGADFTPLVGRKVSLLLSPLGEASRFVGFDALPEIETSPGRTLDKESYVNQLKHLLPALPDGPVAVGGTWTDEYTVRQARSERTVTTNVSVTYTLVGETVVRGLNCLDIDAESSISVKGQGTMRDNPYTMEMTGTVTAKVYFAHERGMMLERNAKSTLEGSIKSMGMSIPVRSEGESKTEVTFR